MDSVGAPVGKVGPVLTVVARKGSARAEVSLLDNVVWEGARQMPAAALKSEIDGSLADLAEQRDQDGQHLVVRNGYQ